MKKSLVVLSGAMALSLAIAPIAFAAQGAQAQPAAAETIELTNAAVPSVQQEGSVTVEKNPVTLDDGSVVTPSASADGVESSELEVYVTGSTDVSSDASAAVGEAQAVANAALAVAQETGNTAESMLATNAELASSGLTANSIVTTEFYVGIQDKAGKAYSGTVTVALNLPSAEEAAQVSMVLYYNATTKKWVSVPFTRSGNKIVLQVRMSGVYRFVTNV